MRESGLRGSPEKGLNRQYWWRMKKITQSNGTTLRISPKLDELGILGIGNVADAILDGTYVPPLDTTPEVVNVL